MIPNIITDTSITFIARGLPRVLTMDHPKFTEIKEMLTSGSDDVETILALSDPRVAVEQNTDGAVTLNEEGMFLGDEKLPETWEQRAVMSPASLKILTANAGDRVRVEGDDDAPDGIYTIGEVDNQDCDKRVYVESDVDYFGFVANTSIKEILKCAE
jgi:hypothetical protein